MRKHLGIINMLVLIGATGMLVACDLSDGSITGSKSPYSNAEVVQLKRRAAELDMQAMSALETHYAFEGQMSESDKWTAHLILLGEKGALENEAERMYIDARPIPYDNPERLLMLREAMFLFKRSSDGEPKSEQNDSTVRRYEAAIYEAETALDASMNSKKISETEAGK